MQRNHRSILVLDCPFLAWCAQRRQEFAMRCENAPERARKELPFTFNDVPPPLAGIEQDIVLKPTGGVKS